MHKLLKKGFEMDNKKLLDLILKTFPENKDISLAVERENYMYLHYELLCEKQKALNIDTKTEALIQKSVDKLSKEKTSIFIAHRLSTIVNVDKIIVLSKGEILEQGSHQELLQIPDGYYHKLYDAYYEQLMAT